MAKSKPLTYNDFFQALKKTPRGWTIHSDGRIRNSKGLSPLQVVFKTTSLMAIYPKLDFDALRIVRAEDNMEGYENIREDLLSTCGLKEKK